MTAATVAVTPDFDPLTVSPIKKFSSFRLTTPTEVVPDLSTTETIASVSKPVSCSPRIKSWFDEFGPENPLNVSDGKSGSEVSLDSKTPNNWTASGTFRHIFSSWTLVP